MFQLLSPKISRPLGYFIMGLDKGTGEKTSVISSRHEGMISLNFPPTSQLPVWPQSLNPQWLVILPCIICEPSATGELRGFLGGQKLLFSFLYCKLLLVHFFFFLRFYLFIFREGERKEKERERNINVWLPLMCPLLRTWPTTQPCVLTGNWTSNSLVLRSALNPLSYMSQGCLCISLGQYALTRE